MGGRAGCPLGASPVMKNCTAFSVSHPGRPAMLGEVSAQMGIGMSGANSSFLPCSHLAMTNVPIGVNGVWQSAHWPMAFTRYSPRAICASLLLVPDAADPLLTIARHNPAATATAIKLVLMRTLQGLLV